MILLKRFFFLFVAISFTTSGQDAKEIISKAENVIKGKTAHGTVEMTVVNPDFTRTLKMESWWQGNEKALIVIESPRREAGNKTLKIGNEMWNYLKNTETTIKIPPSMMLQSWNGSDFTNDDLVRESDLSDDYFQKITGEETIDGEKCWEIELKPKPDAPVVWGKLHYYVRKSDNLPARVVYFDENGKPVRRMEFGDVKMMGGRKLPAAWKMISLTKEGHHTEFKMLDMEFDIKLKDRIFSFRELERGN